MGEKLFIIAILFANIAISQPTYTFQSSTANGAFAVTARTNATNSKDVFKIKGIDSLRLKISNVYLDSAKSESVTISAMIQWVDPSNKRLKSTTITGVPITMLQGATTMTNYVWINDFNWSNLAAKPSTFTAGPHVHVFNDITHLQDSFSVKPSFTQLNNKLAGYLTTAYTTSYSTIYGIPLTFSPSPHTHIISSIINLQDSLSNKYTKSQTNTLLMGYLPNTHLPTYSTVIGTPTNLNQFSNGPAYISFVNLTPSGALSILGSGNVFTLSAPSQTPAPPPTLTLTGNVLTAGANSVTFATVAQTSLTGNGSAIVTGTFPNYIITTPTPITPTINGLGAAIVTNTGSVYNVSVTPFTQQPATLIVNGGNISTVGGNTVALPQFSVVAGANVSVSATNGTLFTVIGLPITSQTAAAYASGTPYNLNTTYQKIDFGTTDALITLPASGTWQIQAKIKIEYVGLTTLALTPCNFKLRRTNNTAADITNTPTVFNIPILTLLTQTGGDADLPTIFYTGAAGDILEIWGQLGTAISLGNARIGEACITAVRIN